MAKAPTAERAASGWVAVVRSPTARANVYISTGNGPWNPSQGSYGDSILKFSPTPVKGMLQVVDYFTPQDFGYMNCQDSDLAAGGLLMIPGSTQIIGGGKMGKLYLVNTGNLGS